MSKHIIKLSDFNGYKARVLLASSGSKKMFVEVDIFNNSVNYTVETSSHISDVNTPVFVNALELYNELP